MLLALEFPAPRSHHALLDIDLSHLGRRNLGRSIRTGAPQMGAPQLHPGISCNLSDNGTAKGVTRGVTKGVGRMASERNGDLRREAPLRSASPIPITNHLSHLRSLAL
jgi:hypothetical protein